jgi:hypothetical protein
VTFLPDVATAPVPAFKVSTVNSVISAFVWVLAVTPGDVEGFSPPHLVQLVRVMAANAVMVLIKIKKLRMLKFYSDVRC